MLNNANNTYTTLCARASAAQLRSIIAVRNARYALLASTQAQQVAHYALTLKTNTKGH
jgi:hypothetical protein